jgi:hypothetical protein
LCGMASADGGASALVFADLADRGPLFRMATQLPTDPLGVRSKQVS